jgi:hypothetical protein
MDDFVTVCCPYCGESFSIELDITGGNDQIFVSDCEVCCRPVQFHIHYDDTGNFTCEAAAEA